MALSINTNMSSLLAIQSMNRNSSELSKTFQRLTTGSRLNSAGDDPAGLAISTRLTAKIRGSNVAMRNVQDAVSVTQVADSALQSTQDSLQKMRDLYVSAAGPGVSSTDRQGIQTEVQGLISEMQRLALGTTFNGRTLLTGSYNAKFMLTAGTSGMTSFDNLRFTISAVSVQALSMSIGAGLGSIGAGVASQVQAASYAWSNVKQIDKALNSVSSIRARLGAVQNRLSSVLTGLNSLVAATTEANSRITDADISSEVASMTSQQIKQQVGAAILAQANQGPAAILTLLK